MRRNPISSITVYWLADTAGEPAEDKQIKLPAGPGIYNIYVRSERAIPKDNYSQQNGSLRFYGFQLLNGGLPVINGDVYGEEDLGLTYPVRKPLCTGYPVFIAGTAFSSTSYGETVFHSPPTLIAQEVELNGALLARKEPGNFEDTSLAPNTNFSYGSLMVTLSFERVGDSTRY